MDSNSLLASTYSSRNPKRAKAQQLMQYGTSIQATDPAGVIAKALAMGMAGQSMAEADQYDQQREEALLEKEKRQQAREDRLMEMKEAEFAQKSNDNYFTILKNIGESKVLSPMAKQAIYENMIKQNFAKAGLNADNVLLTGVDFESPDIISSRLENKTDGTVAYLGIGRDNVPYEFDPQEKKWMPLKPETLMQFGKGALNFTETNLGDRIRRTYADGRTEDIPLGINPGTAASLGQAERHFQTTRNDRLNAAENKDDISKNPYFATAMTAINNNPELLSLSPSEKINLGIQEAAKIEQSLRSSRKGGGFSLQGAYAPGGPVGQFRPGNAPQQPPAAPQQKRPLPIF